MTSGPVTPPPAGRLSTPPAPRHGPSLDTWEPYSPRRSSRVQEQEKRKQRDQRCTTEAQTPLQPSSATSPYLTTLKRHTSNQTLSPPSSPEPCGRSSRNIEAVVEDERPRDLDKTTRNGSFSPSQAPNGMLPTPRKTPHRRNKVTSSSRIIQFQSHPQEQFLPSSRKRNKRFTLDSPSVSPSTSQVHVHVDSQDQIPEMDRSDDNPFVGPRPQNPDEYPMTVGRRRLNREERQMERDVKDGKGLIFMFRGRMMFRPFEDTAGEADDSDRPKNVYSSQTTRVMAAAGVTASRPLTRSNVKPRLLWTSDDHLLYQDDSDETGAHEHDEEALTDIEETPEPKEMLEQANDGASVRLLDAKDDESPLLLPNESKRGSKRPSPFDTWPRQKPGSSTRSSSAGTKRSAPQSEEESVGKRTRSSDPEVTTTRT